MMPLWVASVHIYFFSSYVYNVLLLVEFYCLYSNMTEKEFSLSPLHLRLLSFSLFMCSDAARWARQLA